MHQVIHYGQVQAFLHDPATAPLMPYMIPFLILTAVFLVATAMGAKENN
ncbi:hypothetical protein E1O_15350 [Burkholderiales bacterium GJ-E10]|nr:hypothetical protein E1O_15350 [Burkholderiales bacterium GJ-E10]